MPRERPNEMTYDGLQRFLKGIGFEQSLKINRSLALHHRDSGTIVTLSIPEDGRTVRPADLLSVAVRLEAQGLVAGAALDQFKSGKLPMAS